MWSVLEHILELGALDTYPQHDLQSTQGDQVMLIPSPTHPNPTLTAKLSTQITSTQIKSLAGKKFAAILSGMKVQ